MKFISSPHIPPITPPLRLPPPSPGQGVRAPPLAPPQRLATGLDRYDLWVTVAVDEGRGGRLEPRRVSSRCSLHNFLLTQPLDRQVAGKLARVQRRRRSSSSLPASTVPVGWYKPDARSAKTRFRGAAARSVPYPVPHFFVVTMLSGADTA